MKKLTGIIAAIFLFTAFFESCSSKKTDEAGGGQISGTQDSVTETSENINPEEPEMEAEKEEDVFPKVKKFYMTADNLKIRSEEGVKSETLYVLPKETRVFVTELGTVEEIDGTKAAWAKVVMESGTDLNGKKIEGGATGWCFGSYLYEKWFLTAQEIAAVLSECPTYDYYIYSFYFESDDKMSISYGNYYDDITYTMYKYKIEDGCITITNEADNDGNSQPAFEDGTTFNLEYDLYDDGYTFDSGEHCYHRREDSILYDKENDMLFVRCRGSKIYSAEESFFYSRTDASSEKITYREYVYPEPEGCKVYNMDRVFTGQEVYVDAKSLYPAFDNKYWYSTQIDRIAPRKAYVLCSEGEGPSDNDYSVYSKEFRKYQMQRVEELAKQGALKIKPLTEEEKQSILHTKWTRELYKDLFREDEK